jgi:glycogen debranching enzyme
MTTELLLRVYPDHLFASRGRSLLITDRGGAIAGGLQGLYEHDLRLLSRYRLLVHGRPPRLDASSAVDPYSTLAYYICPPTSDDDGAVDALGLSVQEQDRQVVIRVSRFVGQGLHEDLEVTNHGLGDARLELAWELDADFADLVEARGGKRQQDAPVSVDWHSMDGERGELHFQYQHPQLDRGTLVRFSSPGSTPRYENGRVFNSLTLGPQASGRLCLVVTPVVDGRVREPLFGCDAFGAVASDLDVASRGWVAAATSRPPTRPCNEPGIERLPI